MSNAAPHREAILVARKFFLERVDEDCASRRGLAMSDGSLEITYRNFAHGSVLDVRGELDVAHASTLGIAVYHALGAKPKRLVIDLAASGSLTSAGLPCCWAPVAVPSG